MARGLLMASALVLVASAASAAPAKHKKPQKKAVPAAVSPDDSTTDTPNAAPAVAVESSAPAPADSSSKPSNDSASKAELPPVAEADSGGAGAVSAPIADSDLGSGPSAQELEAIGRREAARIAAGRIQVAVWAAVDMARRSFKYSDPIGPQYAPYRLPLAPMLSMGLEAYPFASSDVPGLRDLGFRAHVSKAFAVDSKTPDGATINTSWTRFGGEARQRLLFPSSHPLELGLSIGADGSYFDMSTRSVVQGLLPSARTLAVQLGLDARLELVSRFSLALGVAYLAPTVRGAIYNRFRDPHVHGIDGDFAAILGLAPGLEARASARYTRYFASFQPELGDSFVAGGALDEQFQFGLGVRYAH